MAKARDIPDLDSEGSYGQAAARIVSTRAREVVDHAAGVLDTGDIERVHDMRVATRRLRAALEIFEPCFPAKRFRRGLDEVKELADALGERRDRDVAIEVLTKFSAEIAMPDRPGVDGLIGELREEQRKANEELASYVTPENLAALHERLTELVAMARGVERPGLEEGEMDRSPSDADDSGVRLGDAGSADARDEEKWVAEPEDLERKQPGADGGVAFADGGTG